MMSTSTFLVKRILFVSVFIFQFIRLYAQILSDSENTHQLRKTKADSLPNVIVFLVDDMGWRDTELNGSTFYESPNQLKLAEQGITFSQAYAQPLCSPTRAALLSGKYPGARLHMHVAITGSSVANPSVPSSCNATEKMCWPSSRNYLPLNEITIAERLKQRGYKTIHIGKWHLGGPSYYPDKQGFDEMIGSGGAGTRSYFSPYQFPNLKDGPAGEYLCERLTEEACNMMEKYQEQPFFLYLAHVNVHSPYQARQDMVDYYAEKADPHNAQRHPKMGAMLHAVDESLGRIMDKLDELELAENTLLIFLSDNGGVHWANDNSGPYQNIPITSNAPLEGGKANYYEGGVRVPMVVRWPNKIPAKRTNATPVHAVDLYPTILEATGATQAEGQILDGQSIMPLLTGEGELSDRPLFCHFPRKKIVGSGDKPGGSFVRMGDYKLIRIYGDGPNRSDRYELYNIAEDMGEKKNLAGNQSELVDSMKTILQKWLDDTGALLPKKNPNYPTTSVDESEIPTGFQLRRNYPNPFNPTTTIGYQLEQAGHVRLCVYDILGDAVKTLVHENQNSGTYAVHWDATNSQGRVVAGGLYFYKLDMDMQTQMYKMVLLK